MNKSTAKSKHQRTRHRARKASSPSEKSPQVVERPRSTAVKIDALPPNENLRKHPDEVYGDTEIPRRGKLLDDLKRDSE
ncbi:MAG TPA: hypothetical protein VMH89_04115 [Candidatus Acidoferrum sp.]|nr:hypothetical protein [Candidatus Acidoferrum sp.]